MADQRYDHFPPGFFDRQDPSKDRFFYTEPRLVTHIDDGAIAAVGQLYNDLQIEGAVLDLMGSWISHFDARPDRLIVHGMNAEELTRNVDATGAFVADLNSTPAVPLSSSSCDAAVCAVSIDYLTRPLEVMDDLARVVRPGGRAIISFSNRLFPTKAIRGWLAADDQQRCSTVGMYFHLATGWGAPTVLEVSTNGRDPLYAVWADRAG